MGIKQTIDQDLKTALLAGEKEKATLLRGLKSAFLNAEIAENAREAGLSDDRLIDILKKEVKSRVESAELYVKGGSQDRADKELREKTIIEAYLPAQLSDEELSRAVEEAIKSVDAVGPAAMGQVIGKVKQKVGATADGARIATKVKEKLQ